MSSGVCATAEACLFFFSLRSLLFPKYFLLMLFQTMSELKGMVLIPAGFDTGQDGERQGFLRDFCKFDRTDVQEAGGPSPSLTRLRDGFWP